MLDFSSPDTRPPKLGWATGWYCNNKGCSNCGKVYTGAKRSYHCADCAYNYEDKIEYERVWNLFAIIAECRERTAYCESLFIKVEE